MEDPIKLSAQNCRTPGDALSLSGRPKISIDVFIAVATEVAKLLEEPVAICRRPEADTGTRAIPFVNRPLQVARADGNDIVVIVEPPKD